MLKSGKQDRRLQTSVARNRRITKSYASGMYDGNNSAVLILYLVPHYISFYLLFLSLAALLMAGRTMVTCPKFPAVAT